MEIVEKEGDLPVFHTDIVNTFCFFFLFFPSLPLYTLICPGVVAPIFQLITHPCPLPSQLIISLHPGRIGLLLQLD